MMEKMPAAVINGLIPCHVSLHVQVDAAGRSTPLDFTNQLRLSRFIPLSPLVPMGTGVYGSFTVIQDR